MQSIKTFLPLTNIIILLISDGKRILEVINDEGKFSFISNIILKI